MAFVRDRLPEPHAFFEAEGLTFIGPRGKWRTTTCEFHGGSDSMRANMESGAWVCMSCGVKGGDVLAYRMQISGCDFVQACKELGAWEESDRPSRVKPLPFSARDALGVLCFEATLTAVAASNIANGVTLTDDDRTRLLRAASRIAFITDGVSAA